jgi:hypothetical protein
VPFDRDGLFNCVYNPAMSWGQGAGIRDRMAGSDKPRVVSGDFKAGPPDVIDADYVRLPSGTREAFGNASPHRSVAPPPGGMDVLRQRPPEAPRREPGGPLFWTVGTILVAATFWISGGHALFRDLRLFSQTEPKTLRIVNVSSRVDASGGKAVLLVDGETLNEGKAVEHLPAIEIAVTGNDGLITRYRLGTSGRPLAPGETFGFSSRLDAPKNGMKAVSVTFVE